MTSALSKPSRADDWDTLRREIGPIDELRENAIAQALDYADAPVRIMLGIDPAVSPEEWEWRPEPIWVVPDPALQWGFDNRHHLHAGNTMILPAVEQEWRDNQHYRAYVRPTKEEA